MSDMILIQASDFDPVGKPAFHIVGGAVLTEPLGIVEKVYRFGEVEGMKATPADPLYRVGGAVFPEGELVIGLVGQLHETGNQAGNDAGTSPLVDSGDTGGQAAGD